LRVFTVHSNCMLCVKVRYNTWKEGGVKIKGQLMVACSLGSEVLPTQSC